MKEYRITTKLRICHFLAQILHESMMLSAMEENLNYSAAGLLSIFPKYFDKQSSLQYARKPENIANKVYSSRMGNGKETSGDGWKYRGRSAIHITGKNNYADISKALGVDFVTNPELLSAPENCIKPAGYFWDKAKLNAWADKDDITTISKRINGGLTGLEERKKILARCKIVLK
jgi:putative chitinase